MPILHGVVEAVARAAGVTVRRHGVANDAAAVVDRPQRPRAAADPLSAVEGRPWVLFAGNDGELLRQLPVVKNLCDAGANAVQVYKRADARTLARLAEVGHDLWHESWLDTGEVVPGSWDSSAARTAFDRAATTAPANLRPLLSDPAMAGHWDFIFGDYACAMAGHVRRWSAMLDRCPPAAVVACYPTLVLDLAAARGIPGVLLPHGLLVHGDTALYAHLSAPIHCAALSAGHAERLARAGVSPARITVTGDPGAVDLAECLAAAPRSAASGQRVLLLAGHSTAPTVLGRLPEVNWQVALEDLAQLAVLAERRPTWDVRLRRHPRYDYDPVYYQRLSVQLDMSDDLVQAVECSDVVVVANALTSAQVEAAVVGVPVLVLDSARVWCTATDWGVAGWPTVSSVADVEAAVVGLFDDPARYAAAAAATRAAVTEYLGPVTETVERCRALCGLPIRPVTGRISRC